MKNLHDEQKNKENIAISPWLISVRIVANERTENFFVSSSSFSYHSWLNFYNTNVNLTDSAMRGSQEVH